MKIVQIVPGSGGSFYCQNCVRDLLLVSALRELGHDVVIVPMYLPLISGEDDIHADSPVFFGAVKTYLKQRHGFLRHMPRLVERYLDSPGMLDVAARKARTVQARGLGEMTLAMLNIENSPHYKEVERMLFWISANEKPDVIHLSNVLLAGLARRLKEKLHATVVCSLQDEDSWIDAMKNNFRDVVWKTITERIADVDGFIAVSRHYADVMKKRLGIPDGKMHVVYPGIQPGIFHQAPVSFRPPIIGYVSRMSESLGLGVLIEAFIRIKADRELKHVRLRITGGQLGEDVTFISNLRERIARLGMANDVDVMLDFDEKRRLDFLQTISMFSVPAPAGEAFSLPSLEALASGVPLVLPDTGAARELIEITGGGVLYDPSDIKLYVEALKSMLNDQDKAREMGKRGREVVISKFTAADMARNTIQAYENIRSR